MAEPGSTRKRGRPFVAVFAVLWIGMGFNAIGEGRTWLGVCGVALGVLYGSTWLWPESAVTRFMSKPLIRRKRPADR